MLPIALAKRLAFVVLFGAVVVTGLAFGVVDLAHAADLSVR
jgi:hypothetical protein